MITCKYTSRLTATWLLLISRLEPKIARCRSLLYSQLEARGVAFNSFSNSSFRKRHSFCHPGDRTAINTINSILPLDNKRLQIMEKTSEGLSAGPWVTKNAKSPGKVTQEMETTDMSERVTDVNQKDSPVNQSSFVRGSLNQLQEHAPLCSKQEIKNEQCLSKETQVLYTKSDNGFDESQNLNSPNVAVGSDGDLVTNKMKCEKDLSNGACVLPAKTDNSSGGSQNMNSSDVAIKSENDLIAAEFNTDETQNAENNESFQIFLDANDSDLKCDDGSLELYTLFNDSLQCSDMANQVTPGRVLQQRKGRKRVDCNKQGSNCDDESFGLENRFDADLQSRDPARWATPERTLTSTQRRGERRKGEGKLSTLSGDDEVDMDNTSVNKDDSPSKPKKKPKRIVPNYFVAIRVSNPHIHSGVKIVQDSIVTHNESLKAALIPLATLHLTLLVVHLDDDEQIQKAADTLQYCRTSLEPILQNSTLTLNFSGLDHFGHQVLFVKLCGEEGIAALNSVANIVRETFTKEGIPSTDPRDFNPHLTVMKLYRSPKLRKKGIKKIPVEIYANWVDFSFGEEPVNALYLCSMNAKDKDGFYKCVASLKFEQGGEPDSESHTGPGNVPNENSIDDTEKEEQKTSESTIHCDMGSGTVENNIQDSNQ